MWKRWEGTYTTWMGLLGAFTGGLQTFECKLYNWEGKTSEFMHITTLTVKLLDLELGSSQVVLLTQHLGSIVGIWWKRGNITDNVQSLCLSFWQCLQKYLLFLQRSSTVQLLIPAARTPLGFDVSMGETKEAIHLPIPRNTRNIWIAARMGKQPWT